jgi:hypothetical protein
VPNQTSALAQMPGSTSTSSAGCVSDDTSAGRPTRGATESAWGPGQATASATNSSATRPSYPTRSRSGRAASACRSAFGAWLHSRSRRDNARRRNAFDLQERWPVILVWAAAALVYGENGQQHRQNTSAVCHIINLETRQTLAIRRIVTQPTANGTAPVALANGTGNCSERLSRFYAT